MFPNNTLEYNRIDHLKSKYANTYGTWNLQILMLRGLSSTQLSEEVISEGQSLIKRTKDDLKEIIAKLIQLTKNQKQDENEDYLEMPNFGNNEVDLKELEGIPSFSGQANETTLYGFWRKLCHLISMKKLSKEA